jgi:hypothetical protein
MKEEFCVPFSIPTLIRINEAEVLAIRKACQSPLPMEVDWILECDSLIYCDKLVKRFFRPVRYLQDVFIVP